MNHSYSNKHALIFGFISVFLTGLGLTIVNPVLPFLVAPYVKVSQQASVVTCLAAAYATALFLAAPILGALSDHFGRRPILIISLIGAAIGYSIFGVGGSLRLLFLGRIIDGITGGEIAAIFAYFADITPVEKRTHYFGWISAIVGIGTALGPVIGGLLANFGNNTPFFVGAAISILNAAYGFFFMPESLPQERRSQNISFQRLNPLKQLVTILKLPIINRLLFTAFLLWLPNGGLQSIFSQFSIDTFAWKPTIIGLMFSLIGILDIVSQTFLMPLLLKHFSDQKIISLGMIAEIFGYLFIGSAYLTQRTIIFVLGMIIFSLGDAIFNPAFNGLLSKSADENRQGQVQGGAQSIQALARIIGPIVVGQLYHFSHFSPAVLGVVFIFCSFLFLQQSKPALHNKKL
ncbi:tetracycline resistance MFS efflux pump [Enterococcus saigonensis]|uniref:Tetracycline resistance MFS efflux pump n=1 Tax=Enterococcus saigonensis TaxID=1805431 RepID=A0A679I9A0_9ENTE|nr:MFS transporter [Enterococcus saigonensis]BCA86198.1 tetracycline resistance MFS efflux pump [Enterococcus saigonensis]